MNKSNFKGILNLIALLSRHFFKNGTKMRPNLLNLYM